ncbi:MAG: DUF4333 domain-containing protein [Pseudonocardia sp.]
MSTPQGPNPPPDAADQPSGRPGWGQPPPGGWGQQPPYPPGQPDPTRVWSPPPSGPPPPHPSWSNHPPGQQPTQQQWAPHPGAPQPAQQWPAPPPGRSDWNQQQWPGQGYPGAPDPAARNKSALPWIIGAMVVVLGLVAVLGFVTPAFLVSRVFDQAALQQGVQQVLIESYGIAGVESVTCEAGVEVTAGESFECAAVVEGEDVTVPIRITSATGDYEVGRPL